MRSPEEVRELWRRLTNPVTVEDWHLGIPLEDIKQCPEIWAVVKIYLPTRMTGQLDQNDIIVKSMAKGMQETREKIYADVLNKEFVP